MKALWLHKGKTAAIFLISAAVLSLATTGFSAESKPGKKRGWLGVSVQELTPSLRDAMNLGNRSGLLINEVIDGSPAEDAGLREEDVLLEFNGQKVERADRLTELVRDTEPGTEVEVKIFRKGEEETMALTVGRMKPRTAGFYSFGSGDNNAFVIGNRPMLGVRVTELNDDLAAYFKVGKDDGVLVLEVTEDSPANKAGLKAGDVIAKIDGDKVQDHEELMELLSYYDDGEEVTLDYIRQGKNSQAAVTLEAPDAENFGPRTPDGKNFNWNFFERDGNRIHFSAPRIREHFLQDDWHHLKDDDRRVRIRVRGKKAGDSI